MVQWILSIKHLFCGRSTARKSKLRQSTLNKNKNKTMKELRTPHSTGGFSQCNKTRDIIGIKIEKETLDCYY